MKTAFLLAASALLSASFANAQCMPTDVSAISALPEYKVVSTSCGTVDTGIVAIPGFVAAYSPLCKPDCINAIQALNRALPACAANGLSLTAPYDAALKSCGVAASPASSPPGTLVTSPTAEKLTTSTAPATSASADKGAASAAPATSASAETNVVTAAVGIVAAALALVHV